MKKISVPLIALFVLSCFFISCRKDNIENGLQPLNNDQTVERLKSYYKTQTLLGMNNSVSSKSMILSTDIPDWESTLFSREKNMYIVPVDIKASSASKNLSVYKYLVVNESNGKMNGVFYYAIADNLKTNKAISPQQVLEHISFTDGVPTEATDPGYSLVRSALNKNELMYDPGNKKGSGNYISLRKAAATSSAETSEGSNFAPYADCTANGGTPVTIDWYYQTYENGALVYEEYLYSTKECWGGSGGGGGGGGTTYDAACAQSAQAFVGAGVVKSDLVASTTLSETMNEKVDRYDWKIFDALTWGIISLDKIIWTRPSKNLAWTYSSYLHIDDQEVGASIGGTRTYAIKDAYAKSYISSALVTIVFAVTHQPVCEGVPKIIPSVTILYNANKVFKPKGVIVTYDMEKA